MKSITILLTLLLINCATQPPLAPASELPSTPYKRVEITKDKFVDAYTLSGTEVNVKDVRNHEVDIQAYGTSYGKYNRTTLRVISYSESGFKYLGCKDIRLFVDGEVPEQRTEYGSDVFSYGAIMEFFSVSAANQEAQPEFFKKLNQSKTVKLKICNDEFVVPISVVEELVFVNEYLNAEKRRAH